MNNIHNINVIQSKLKNLVTKLQYSFVIFEVKKLYFHK